MKTIQDLEKAEDKLSIFLDFGQLTQYVVTTKDLTDAFLRCLDDNEKLEVIMRSDYFSKLKPYTKSSVIMTINDEAAKRQIIQDTSLMESSFDEYSFMNFFRTLNDQNKMYILNIPDMLKKFNVQRYQMKTIIETMSNDSRTEILSNKEWTKQLGIDGFELTNLIIGLEDDEVKSRLSKEYELSEYDKIGVIKSFSDENKKRIVVEENDGMPDRYIVEIISSFEIDTAVDFINNEQEFLVKKEIKPFQLIKRMSVEKQLQLIERMDEIQLPEAEKRRIYASLRNETKKEINVENIDEKYRKLIEMESEKKFPNTGQICPKLDEDLSQYKDLDELLEINPLQTVKTDEQRKQLLELCKICPNISIEDNLIIGSSTGEEYIKGEGWVDSVLQAIQPEWTDVQKLAYIDTMVGKKISYTPDFGTEVEDGEDARALWKIITNGYGVCNGIAQVEQYLLGRVGIEAEIVSAKTHAFVKVKNIQIPTENGVIQGDTLVDPTWNLTASRYGARPQHFCKSYEELRKVDIDANGVDHNCHKNEELEKQETINMDVRSLREVYKSIGIADKEGNFPIAQLIGQARKIDENSTDMQSNINSKFALLKKWCPEFASCQNSTIDVLRDVLFENNDQFNFKRCIASRVYDKEDSKKQAVLYVYMELEDTGKQFFYADKEIGEFIQMSQEEFERKFECYEADIQKLPGNKRPWETEVEIQEKKENSSGEIVAEEGR